MTMLPESKLPMTAEGEGDGAVVRTFDDIRRTMEIPFVPNLYKGAAGATNVLSGTWAAMNNVFLQTSLPMSLASMILYSIAAAKRCRYCSAVHQVTCKTLGVDEDTLQALGSDLAGVSPQRVQEIVQFAVKCALEPQSLGPADYDGVRAQGVSDQEMLEIIGLAALGNYLDTLADAMKVEVDDVFKEAGSA